MVALWLGLAFIGKLEAQAPTTNSILSNPGQASLDSGTNAIPIAPIAPSPAEIPTAPVATNAASEATPTPTPTATPAPRSVTVPSAGPPISPSNAPILIGNSSPSWLIPCALMTLASVAGFLLYQCGLTRAKNCGHTSLVLLVGLVAGLIGYWMGGFAVQTGGIGDVHAALAEPISAAGANGLDHELGPMLGGHHWGLMGSAGYFLTTAETARNGIATLFLIQAAFLAITIAAALSAGLERGRLTALAIGAFLIGALIYPLFANWVWGGGWLAELGREYGLGHGVIDLAGSGVVHQTAGTLALVIAVVLGPRYGRFGRENTSRLIPGHNVPFFVLGTVILFVSWTAANAFASASPLAASPLDLAGSAAVNALLAGAAGLLISLFLSAARRQAPEPAVLCRGLLGGVVAVSASSALIDPWAAFAVGMVAGWLVQAAVRRLERRRIDDPTGAAAVHGAAGAWGMIATGLFANGTGGFGMNGVDGPVRGLFFGGGWHQLAAQALGCVTNFVVIFILGYACLSLIQKILGSRVDLVDETGGLDWPQTGALGYQSDIEPEESNGTRSA